MMEKERYSLMTTDRLYLEVLRAITILVAPSNYQYVNMLEQVLRKISQTPLPSQSAAKVIADR